MQLMSVVVDVVMIMLIIINLVWIVFDWVFAHIVTHISKPISPIAAWWADRRGRI
jgi:hypothetical protein